MQSTLRSDIDRAAHQTATAQLALAEVAQYCTGLGLLHVREVEVYLAQVAKCLSDAQHSVTHLTEKALRNALAPAQRLTGGRR